jgi:hypothetical protein
MRSPSPFSMRLSSISTPITMESSNPIVDMILKLVAARMVKQYEFDAKRWGKGLSAVAVE